MTMFDRKVPNRCTWTRAPARGDSVMVDMWGSSQGIRPALG
jgi:hypothetical protein